MDDEARELEDPETWDHETAEPRPPVENARGVVVVVFTGEELDRVARHAAEAGTTLSAFVRDAALEKVAERSVR